MKAMFLSDLLIIKKYLLQQMILFLIIGAFITFVTESLYIIPPLLSVMMPFSMAFTLMYLDERNKWEQFRLALPLSRNSVIWGRYASLAAIVLIGFIIGLVDVGLVIGASMLLPGIPQLANLMVNFSWQALILADISGLGIASIMISIIVPMVARFGMTKAVRFVPFAIVIIVFGLTGALGGEAAADLKTFVEWIETPEGMLGFAGIVLGAAMVLYAASGALATKLYAQREF